LREILALIVKKNVFKITQLLV